MSDVVLSILDFSIVNFLLSTDTPIMRWWLVFVRSQFDHDPRSRPIRIPLAEDTHLHLSFRFLLFGNFGMSVIPGVNIMISSADPDTETILRSAAQRAEADAVATSLAAAPEVATYAAASDARESDDVLTSEHGAAAAVTGLGPWSSRASSSSPVPAGGRHAADDDSGIHDDHDVGAASDAWSPSPSPSQQRTDDGRESAASPAPALAAASISAHGDSSCNEGVGVAECALAAARDVSDATVAAEAAAAAPTAQPDAAPAALPSSRSLVDELAKLGLPQYTTALASVSLPPPPGQATPDPGDMPLTPRLVTTLRDLVGVAPAHWQTVVPNQKHRDMIRAYVHMLRKTSSNKGSGGSAGAGAAAAAASKTDGRKRQAAAMSDVLQSLRSLDELVDKRVAHAKQQGARPSAVPSRGSATSTSSAPAAQQGAADAAAIKLRIEQVVGQLDDAKLKLQSAMTHLPGGAQQQQQQQQSTRRSVTETPPPNAQVLFRKMLNQQASAKRPGSAKIPAAGGGAATPTKPAASRRPNADDAGAAPLHGSGKDDPIAATDGTPIPRGAFVYRPKENPRFGAFSRIGSQILVQRSHKHTSSVVHHQHAQQQQQHGDGGHTHAAAAHNNDADGAFDAAVASLGNANIADALLGVSFGRHGTPPPAVVRMRQQQQQPRRRSGNTSPLSGAAATATAAAAADNTSATNALADAAGSEDAAVAATAAESGSAAAARTSQAPTPHRPVAPATPHKSFSVFSADFDHAHRAPIISTASMNVKAPAGSPRVRRDPVKPPRMSPPRQRTASDPDVEVLADVVRDRARELQKLRARAASANPFYRKFPATAAGTSPADGQQQQPRAAAAATANNSSSSETPRRPSTPAAAASRRADEDAASPRVRSPSPAFWGCTSPADETLRTDSHFVLRGKPVAPGQTVPRAATTRAAAHTPTAV